MSFKIKVMTETTNGVEICLHLIILSIHNKFLQWVSKTEENGPDLSYTVASSVCLSVPILTYTL